MEDKAEKHNNYLNMETDNDRIKEARSSISYAIGSQFFALYHIWIESQSYVCFREQLTGILSVIGEDGEYQPAWKAYIENYIVAEDRAEMYEFSDINTLADRLQDVQSITHEYRRKEVGWTRGQFIVAKRDVEGRATNVVFAVTDINAEKTRELAQQRVTYEANHDPLTGAYNRKALEEITALWEQKKEPVGFAVIDIDNFKLSNDEYGHEMGDRILIELAAMMRDIFRDGDSVFRLGGDEFAILLRDCTPSAWNKICEKQRRIHTLLDQIFGEAAVTISVGIAFSGEGYSREMFGIADECMYEVKQKGRAGCAMIDMKTGEHRYWRDDTLSYKAQNVMEYNNTGLFRIEYPLDGNGQPRLYCGDVTRDIFCFHIDATPEACYRLWIDNVEPSYRDVLARTRQALLNGEHAECTYQWNHAELGLIYVRTGGVGEIRENLQIIHGYHHSMKNTRIVERDDESQLLVDAMSAIYFCSFYIDIDQDTFLTLKALPVENAIDIHDNSASCAINQFLLEEVDSESRSKMATFTSLDTLGDRLQREKHLDCEYLSCTERGWCRATFFPVRRGENGKVTHVLLVLTSLDEQKALEARRNEENRKSIESLYNTVPCGIVMFEWDGEQLKTLHISAYYEKEYGASLNSNSGGPDFKRIHPDDLVKMKLAIQEALNVTHKLNKEYRVWNQTLNRYLWTRIDAVAKMQANGKMLIYAVYTDVTMQKQLEHNLEKSRNSMIAALGASNLLSYEYDPSVHIGTCFTDDNYFGLPKVIENYPDSLKNIDLFHPDDADVFIQTAHQMDTETQEASCDVRIKRNGEYRWYSCSFNAYNDLQKERKVAILTVVDITDRRAAIDDYNERLTVVLGMVENSLVVGQCNLSENTISFFTASDEMKPFVEGVRTFDERFANIVDYIRDESDREKFRKIFNREHLLNLANRGQTQVKMDYLLRLPDQHTAWIETGVEMVRNPLTGAVTAISYSRNVQNARLSSMLVKNNLKQEYAKDIVVLLDTDEYYTIENKDTDEGNYNFNFWSSMKEALKPIADKLPENLDKEKVLAELETREDYCVSFDSRYFGVEKRLQLRFSYLRKSMGVLLVSLQDITDTALIELLRHENEYDKLTGLYNRKTLFRKGRELIEAYPDEKFAIVHLDFRSFRLYNTFFGEEEGDRLLCDFAELIRGLDEYYDHWVYGRIDADVFCAIFPYREDVFREQIDRSRTFLVNYREDFLIELIIGVYFVADRKMSVEAMFTRATLAAKSMGDRSPYTAAIYDETLEEKLGEEQQILNDIHTAIREEQFEIYLQPKYSLRSNKPVGAEALARWKHPKRGMIYPKTFISAFEHNGFITLLDHYVWEHVCRILSSWKKEGKSLVPVSVNVSRHSMYNKSTVGVLKNLVKKYDIETEYLELELTESVYIDDPDEMRLQMLELKAAGFKILLDDFGSGYSSLNTLREFPVDILKMDMRFLSAGEDDTRGNIVISSVVSMARLLNLEVIAEGVETQEQADFLKETGCEFIQGFFCGRPMPVTEFEAVISGESSSVGSADLNNRLL